MLHHQIKRLQVGKYYFFFNVDAHYDVLEGVVTV